MGLKEAQKDKYWPADKEPYKCEKCGGTKWEAYYGHYVLYGICAKCKHEEELYSG